MDFDAKAEYVKQIAKGERPAHAAVLCGHTPRAVRAALAEDKDFATEVRDATEMQNADVEAAIFKSAKRGNLEAAKYWLSHRSEDWTERVMVKGQFGQTGQSPIQIAQATVLVIGELLTTPDTQQMALRMLEGDIIDADIIDEAS